MFPEFSYKSQSFPKNFILSWNPFSSLSPEKALLRWFPIFISVSPLKCCEKNTKVFLNFTIEDLYQTIYFT